MNQQSVIYLEKKHYDTNYTLFLHFRRFALTDEIKKTISQVEGIAQTFQENEYSLNITKAFAYTTAEILKNLKAAIPEEVVIFEETDCYTEGGD